MQFASFSENIIIIFTKEIVKCVWGLYNEFYATLKIEFWLTDSWKRGGGREWWDHAVYMDPLVTAKSYEVLSQNYFLLSLNGITSKAKFAWEKHDFHF